MEKEGGRKGGYTPKSEHVIGETSFRATKLQAVVIECILRGSTREEIKNALTDSQGFPTKSATVHSTINGATAILAERGLTVKIERSTNNADPIRFVAVPNSSSNDQPSHGVQPFPVFSAPEKISPRTVSKMPPGVDRHNKQDWLRAQAETDAPPSDRPLLNFILTKKPGESFTNLELLEALRKDDQPSGIRSLDAALQVLKEHYGIRLIITTNESEILLSLPY